MSNVSIKEIKRNLISYIQLNDRYMDIDAEYTDEQEDAILDEMENLVSMIFTLLPMEELVKRLQKLWLDSIPINL